MPERRRKLLSTEGGSGFTWTTLVLSILILGVVFALASTTFLSNRRRASGDACNAVLDSIYSAKEQIAYGAKIAPGSATIPLDIVQLNGLLRGVDVRDPCPICGVKYIIGDINTPDGTIIVPVCPCEQKDAGGGKTYGQRGHHIHRRAYMQDAKDGYRRKTGRAFADDNGG